jgi:hypothetical protein
MSSKVMVLVVMVVCLQFFGGCVAFVRDKPCNPCGAVPQNITEDSHAKPLPEHGRAGFFFREVGNIARAIGNSLDFMAEQFRRVRIVPLSSADVKSVHIVVDMEVAMK